MGETIPISLIKRNNLHLLYFDETQIASQDKIESAFIVVDKFRNQAKDIKISINKYLPSDDLKLFHQRIPKTIKYDCENSILADITEVLKMIVSGYTKNNGIVLENLSYISNPRLVLQYRSDKIYPDYDCIFFEKELNLSAYAHSLTSPWFFSGRSTTITFFICNQGQDEVKIHLQNSPDALGFVDDAQMIIACPMEIVDIVPYKFSKFTRLMICSPRRKIKCKIWFQTQLYTEK